MIELFEKYMGALEVDFFGVRAVAVAVSGGADSQALMGLVRIWAGNWDLDVHVLSVDHGLRREAVDEVAMVGEMVADWPRFSHAILNWKNPVSSAIQEQARKARYALMAEYCAQHDIGHLFLGHHQDDQAETVLFRLAKGSGLDGLCGMQGVQAYSEDLKLIRPLLNVSKIDLIEYCEEQTLLFVHDPSNRNEAFARVRLREARDVLEREGLSAKRLSVTALRLSRARQALDEVAQKAFEKCALSNNSIRTVFNFSALKNYPDEIVLRVLLMALNVLRLDADYLPRMEKIEDILGDVLNDAPFRKRTLGGVVFVRDDKADTLVLCLERPLKK